MHTNRFLPALALMFVVGACAPVTTYTDAEAPKNLKLDSATTQVELYFAPGSATLPPAGAAYVRQLAATGRIGPADRVIIAAGGAPHLAEARVGAVSALLLSYGVVALPAPQGGAAPNRAIVEVTRTLVTLPPCPNWSKVSGNDDFGNQPSSNMGCANQTNLGMMIANPTDLASGLPAGPALGQPASAAVRRYLNDNVTPLATASGASPFSASPGAATPGAAAAPGGAQ